MPSQAVTRSLYRTLLRLGGNLDRHPLSRAFIYRTSRSAENAFQIHEKQLLDRIIRDKNFYCPGNTSLTSISALVREQFRSNDVNLLDTNSKVDSAFSFVRKLSSLWYNYNQLIIENISEYNSIYDVGNVITLPKVEAIGDDQIVSGTLLAAHPLLPGVLHRKVVLIIEHNDVGSYGIVINAPIPHTVKSAVKNMPEDIIEKFGSAAVAFGGPVRKLQFLHSVPQVGGLQIPFCKKPMFAGGSLARATAYAKRYPHLVSSNFSFFFGCCTWDSGQLQEEMKSGYWIAAKSQPDLLVALLKSGALSKGRDYDNDPIWMKNSAESDTITIQEEGKQQEYQQAQNTIQPKQAKYGRRGSGAAKSQVGETESTAENTTSDSAVDFPSVASKKAAEVTKQVIDSDAVWRAVMDACEQTIKPQFNGDISSQSILSRVPPWVDASSLDAFDTL